MVTANKVFKLNGAAFAKRVRKMRRVIMALMLSVFAVAMLVLGAMSEELPFLTMIMVGVFLGLVYYFLTNWINGRLKKVFEGFAIEVTEESVLLRQHGSSEQQLSRTEIEGIGKNESGGYALLLKNEAGAFPIPEELENKASLVNAINKFLEEK